MSRDSNWSWHTPIAPTSLPHHASFPLSVRPSLICFAPPAAGAVRFPRQGSGNSAAINGSPPGGGVVHAVGRLAGTQAKGRHARIAATSLGRGSAPHIPYCVRACLQRLGSFSGLYIAGQAICLGDYITASRWLYFAHRDRFRLQVGRSILQKAQ